MATFIDILNKFRKESFSQKDKGFRFERLMQAYLKTTALYIHLFEEGGCGVNFRIMINLAVRILELILSQNIYGRLLGDTMQVLRGG